MMVQPKRKSNSNSSQCKSRAAEPLSAAPCGAVDGQSRPLREGPRGIRGRGRAKARESATRGSSTTALTARSPLSASLLTFEEKGRSVAVVLEQVRSRGPGLHSRSQPADDVALGREGWFEFGRTFPRNCVAILLTQGPYGSGKSAIHITVMACSTHKLSRIHTQPVLMP